MFLVLSSLEMSASADVVSIKNGLELFVSAAEAMPISLTFAGPVLLVPLQMLTELLATVVRGQFSMKPL